MNFDGWMGFERNSTGRMIQIWEDDGSGTALSTKVEVPVATLQNVLRGCDAMDEGTIGFFDAAAINVFLMRAEANLYGVISHNVSGQSYVSSSNSWMGMEPARYFGRVSNSAG